MMQSLNVVRPQVSAEAPAAANQRGRKSVEAKLLKSACKLVAESGPRAVTIRDIAADAGVNHGQIHHYFGGKQNLLEQAYRHLAAEHVEHLSDQDGASSNGRPSLFSLGSDNDYSKAVVRAVLDGNMEFVRKEIKDNLSIPRRALEQITHSMGLEKPSVEIKAALAVSCSIELAWAALEDYLLTVVDASEDEVDDIRRQVALASRQHIQQLRDANT